VRLSTGGLLALTAFLSIVPFAVDPSLLLLLGGEARFGVLRRGRGRVRHVGDGLPGGFRGSRLLSFQTGVVFEDPGDKHLGRGLSVASAGPYGGVGLQLGEAHAEEGGHQRVPRVRGAGGGGGGKRGGSAGGGFLLLGAFLLVLGVLGLEGGLFRTGGALEAPAGGSVGVGGGIGFDGGVGVGGGGFGVVGRFEGSVAGFGHVLEAVYQFFEVLFHRFAGAAEFFQGLAFAGEHGGGVAGSYQGD